jgi:hypothetical protein
VTELLNSTPVVEQHFVGGDFSTFTTMQPVKKTALVMLNTVTITILFFIFAGFGLFELLPNWCA